MRRVLLCCVALILCAIPTGCWNRMELNKLGITLATGFDREGSDWEMSYQLIVPSASGASQGGGGSGGGNQPSVHVFTTKGKTVREAVDLGYLENPRRLYFGHTDVLFIGKAAAESGINEILDLYLRNIDSRETVLVAVTDRTAAEMLRMMEPPEKIPGTALADMMRMQEKFSSHYPAVKVYQLAQKLVSDARTAGVPEITVSGENEKELKSQDVNKSTSPSAKMKISRLGIFHGDRLVGYLNRKQSYGINWLTDEIKGSTLAFSCAGSENSEQRGSVRIIRAKTKVLPVKEGEHYKMQVRTEVTGDLLMEYKCGGDLSKPGSIREVEKEVADEIKEAIEEGWEASRKLRVDLPGFADKIHRKDPKGWKDLQKNWDEELARIELDVHVKVRIQRPGLFKKSFEFLQDKTGAEDGS